MTEQPMPTQHPDAVPIFPEVLRLIEAGRSIVTTAGGRPLASPDELTAIMEARRAKGVATYGVELHTHNGRSMARDALEEAADLLVYAVGRRVEIEAGGAKSPEDSAAMRASLALLWMAVTEIHKILKAVGPA